MRRCARLFYIVQLMRGRSLTTASFLAHRQELSERTVHRDVADLQHQGVPTEDAVFRDEDGKTLDDFLRQAGPAPANL